MPMKKLVLVTGWSSWIGKSICELFATKWYDVAMNYLNNLSELKPWIKAFQGDMSNQDQIERLFDDIYKTYWRYPDILINNAALVSRTKFPDLTWDDMDALLKVNTVGPYRVTREFFIRNTKDYEWKVVIFLWSYQWMTNLWRTVDYAASKAAVHSMVVTLAKACTPVRVCWIAPGYTLTPMHKDNYARLDEQAEKSILKRYSLPEEIANMTLFLASESAIWITGQTYLVDNWRSLYN